MKKRVLTGAAAFLLVVSIIAAAGLALSPEPAIAAPGADDTQSSQAAQTRTIVVNGQGTVKVKPDVAYVMLGVQTESKDAKDAQARNAELMEKVIAAAKAQGIADKDMQTSGYSMYPQYNYYNYDKNPEITGYTVSNNITITVRDIEKTGNVLDAAVKAGANMAGSISFNISDPAPYYQDALKAAMENAKQKGQAIAGSIGVTLDLPVSIVEQSYYYAPTQYGNYDMALSENGYSTPIKTGDLEISASVQVTYGY